MVVFNSRESGEAGIYLVNPLVGVPHRIALNGLDGQIPRWSRDGKWIYFQGAPVNTGGLYKVGIAGGIPQLVTESPGTNAQESRDGSSLYFTRGVADADLYVRDLLRGVERKVDGMPSLHTPVDWVLASNGIYFVSTATKEASICFFDLSVARVTRSWPLPRPPDFWGGLSLSPDESWLAYSQVDRNESDLKLAEPFH